MEMISRLWMLTRWAVVLILYFVAVFPIIAFFILLAIVVFFQWLLTGKYGIFDWVWDRTVEPVCDLGAHFLGLGR